jgi:hypothetical protein
MHVKWIIFIISLFLGTYSFAQTAQDPNEILDQRLGKEWKGIIYICQPFCKFIAIRENTVWNPPLTSAPTDWKHLKSISQTDPIYPLLIVNAPVLPFVQPRIPHEKSPKEKVIEQPPEYAKMDFKWGFAASGGFHAYQSSWKSNTTLQEDLSSEEFQISPVLLLQFMTGQPNRLFSLWLLHQLDLQIEVTPDYKSGEKGLLVQNQTASLSYQAWFPTRHFKVGPRLTYENEQWTVPANALQHFSFNRQSWLGGISLLWNRWQFILDTTLTSQISEQQTFRQEPLEQKWYRFKLQNCSADLSLFDISFGLCGGVSFLSDQQSAAFADNILIKDESDLKRTDVGAYFLIRIGEDLFK